MFCLKNGMINKSDWYVCSVLIKLDKLELNKNICCYESFPLG